MAKAKRQPDPNDPFRENDPVSTHPAFGDTESKIAIASHPVHAMMVAFPICAAFGVLGADLAYWWTGDAFWGRAGVWAIGCGFWIGVAAGIVGTIELLAVPGIRIRSASWTHFILAMTLLSVMGANWMLRLDDPAGAVLPYGLLLSAMAAVMTGLTGWHGGKLVFDYQIGTLDTSGSGRD